MSYTSTIEVGKVKQAGADLIDHTTKMYNALSAISREISESSKCFDSAAGSQLRSQFAKTAAEFENFKGFLMSYGQFLQTHGANVDTFETAVTDILSQIPQL